jgi:DNA polymerase-1
MKDKTLVLLDAHAIIHRAYHALPDFANSKGEPTGALYGIVAMLVNIINEIKPDYIAACFDLPKPTFRHQVYKEYKGGRKKTDDALIAQIIRSRDIFKTFNIPIYELEGFEADDLIGTIVEQVTDETPLGDGVNIVIASGDMDTMQLVQGKRVQVYTLKKGVKDTIMYDEEGVVERFGFVPDLLPDYKGLRGDPSDNIPGIKGVGEKTATSLITTFGDLDAIYTAIESEDEQLKEIGITPRLLGLLIEGKDEAYFSKMLATISREVPVAYEVPVQEWLTSVDVSSVLTLVSELELRTLLPRVRTLLGGDVDAQETQSVVEESIPDGELREVSILLWLLKSDITNPTLDDILQFTNAKNWKEAKHTLTTLVKERGLQSVYEKIEKPLIPIIEKMNATGVVVDIEYFKNLSEEYHTELNRIEKEIYEMAGREFNIRSPKQLGEVLFVDLGLTSKKKTTSGQYSTNEKELKKLEDENPIITKVFEYRELQKLLSTYVDNLPKMAKEEVGERGEKQMRLHTQFLQSGTTTGRMASNNPNMQNIPTKSEYGKRVRGGFIAPKDFVLVSLDYSQIELRIAAILSRDEKLLQTFTQGGDIHTTVATEVFNVPESEVTRVMRGRAKVINFGILYGMGVNALRASLQEGGDEVSLAEARKYLNTYFEQFSGLARWIDSVKDDAARLGYTETLFGRKRYFEGMQSKLPFIRAAAERMAVNAPIQGSNADIIKLATIAIDEYIVKNKIEKDVRLILQVHDELIFEMREDTWQKHAKEIQKRMEDVLPEELSQGVPIIAEIKSGPNWATLAPYKTH